MTTIRLEAAGDIRELVNAERRRAVHDFLKPSMPPEDKMMLSIAECIEVSARERKSYETKIDMSVFATDLWPVALDALKEAGYDARIEGAFLKVSVRNAR